MNPDLRLEDPAGARCSLWWTRAPRYPSHRVGLIGHYQAADPAAAARLLCAACGALAAHGCTLAVGPMDGSVWERYRFITERGTEPPFFGEPENPDSWPTHFQAAGFTPLAHYYSALNVAEPEPAGAPAGFEIRTLNAARLEDELGHLYRISMSAFRENLLFSPLREPDFRRKYRAVAALVRPDLVLLAEHRGSPCGFILAIPDHDRLVVKTLAVVPEHAGRGVGRALLSHVHGRAADLGFRRVIHALMHEHNRSRRLSSHTAIPIRRYTLFARRNGGTVT